MAVLLATSLWLAIQPSSFARMLQAPPFTASAAFSVSNPDLFINLTEYGFADIAADVSGGGSNPLYFREYLSGEWGAAISHSGAPGAEWLEPAFVFPDWMTNSPFSVTAPFSLQDLDANGVPDVNSDGFNIYTSTIRNAFFSITQTYEFLNTLTGIAEGTRPATVTGPGPGPSPNLSPGSFVTSNKFVLKQTYHIKNASLSPVRDVRLYQFLHGLHSTTAVFDHTNYDEGSTATPPAIPPCAGVNCSDYRFDTTLRGIVRAFVDIDLPFEDAEGAPRRATDATDLIGFVPAIDDAFLQSLLGLDEAAIGAAFQAVGVNLDPTTIAGIARSEVYVVNQDAIAFHSNDAPIGAEDLRVAPFGWETGRYGVFGTDSHVSGKPSTGVHLSVEGGVLNGVADFGPGNKWVSGTQVFALGDLNPDMTVVFDVLLSVSTTQTQTQVPTP